MSKKKNNTTTAPPASAAPAPEHGSGRPVVPVLDKPAARALWAALGTHPGSTTAVLADTAGVGLSTARRVLTGWESAGAVRSYTDPASPRAAKTWTTAELVTAEPAAPEPASPEPVSAEPAGPADLAEEAAPDDTATDAAADHVPDTAVAAPTGDEHADPAPDAPVPADDTAAGDAESVVRLPAGALRGQVEDFLRDHPGQEFTPHQIGKQLNRSSGAVHNALVTLTKRETARQTSTAPKKFTFASA